MWCSESQNVSQLPTGLVNETELIWATKNSFRQRSDRSIWPLVELIIIYVAIGAKG
jgi:hypothetical protein